jgi:SSS family transporter
MNTFDYYVALAFSLLVLTLGMMFSRSAKNMKSFFAAGGNVPWWISGLSLFMSFFSVGTFVVWGSIAYSSGFVAITIQVTMAIAGLFIGFVIAPAWNKTGVITVAEFLTLRLGKSVEKIFSSAFLFINLFTAGAFLYPVGKIIEVSTGMPLNTAIILLGLFIIAYTAVGGLWAVLVTDVLQFVVLSAAMLLIIPLAFGEIGGVSSFFEKLPDGFSAVYNDEYSGIFLIAFLIYNTVFIGGNWAYVQRYTSVSKPSNAKKVGLLFGSLYLVAPVIWMLPPMIYRIINPDLQGTEAEEAYLLISKLVLPEGLLGLILGSMIFATASSVNTTLNIAAGVFTNDIFKPLKPNISAESIMKIARVSTLTFGTLAIVIALAVQSMGGIVEVVLTVAALTGAPLYLPPIWALFSKRQTGKSVLITTILSLTINAVFKFITPHFFDLELSRSLEMMVGVLIPIILLSAFELGYKYTNKPNTAYDNYLEAQKARMLAKQQSIQQIPENEPPVQGNLFAMKILSIGVLCIGFLITLLGFFTDKANSETITVGILIAIVPIFFIAKTLRSSSSNSQPLISEQTRK